MSWEEAQSTCEKQGRQLWSVSSEGQLEKELKHLFASEDYVVRRNVCLLFYTRAAASGEGAATAAARSATYRGSI